LRAIRFPLVDLPEQVEAFAWRWPAARADAAGLSFVAEGGAARLRVPLAAPRVEPGEAVRAYLERLPGEPERQLVLLLQAGAFAIGCWHGDDLLHHKAVRKYVVRGCGKAQPTHLKTRGKSRYGSRLRLQNWRSLLRECNHRLVDLDQRFGAFDRLFFAVPVRARSELFAAEPPPPFARDDARLLRIPMHVHRPDHAELLRVRAWLVRGRLELPADGG
jgi:hypothetical protein